MYELDVRTRCPVAQPVAGVSRHARAGVSCLHPLQPPCLHGIQTPSTSRPLGVKPGPYRRCCVPFEIIRVRAERASCEKTTTSIGCWQDLCLRFRATVKYATEADLPVRGFRREKS